MRPLSIAALTVALLVAAAAAARAHPAFDPSAIPPGAPVEATLTIPHGCGAEGGMPEDGEDRPTTLVALRTPRNVTIEPHELEGWTLSQESRTIVYESSGEGTVEPISFPMTIEVTGEIGDTRYVRVVQQCEGVTVRWIGTPNREAEFPAATIELAGEVGQAEGAEDAAHDDHGEPAADEQASAEDAGDDDVVADDGGPVAASSEHDAGGPGWILVLLTVIVVAGGIVGARAVRKGSEA